MPTVITDYLGDGAQWGVKIRYTYEPDRLDTAGSLLLARDWIGDSPFLICGGHFILPELEVEELISFHFQKNGVGTICFKPYPNTSLLGAFGQGVLDAESQLVVFKEKPEVTFSNLIHTTYQVYQPSVLDLIPDDGSAYSIPDFLIPTLLGRSLSIYGYVHSGELINVSTVELYERAVRLADHGALASLQSRSNS